MTADALGNVHVMGAKEADGEASPYVERVCTVQNPWAAWMPHAIVYHPLSVLLSGRWVCPACGVGCSEGAEAPTDACGACADDVFVTQLVE